MKAGISRVIAALVVMGLGTTVAAAQSPLSEQPAAASSAGNPGGAGPGADEADARRGRSPRPREQPGHRGRSDRTARRQRPGVAGVVGVPSRPVGCVRADPQPGPADQPAHRPARGDHRRADLDAGRRPAAAVGRHQPHRVVGVDPSDHRQPVCQLQPEPRIDAAGWFLAAAAEGSGDRQPSNSARSQQAEPGDLRHAVPRDGGAHARRCEARLLGSGRGAGPGGRAAAGAGPGRRARPHQLGPRRGRPGAAARPGLREGRTGPARGQPGVGTARGQAGRGPSAHPDPEPGLLVFLERSDRAGGLSAHRRTGA
jgi:hypothetical protein